ncbi:MAG TPA: metallophosphoesterase [Nitrososphaeraceae archaeon]|nr:metallophosphoesterase [Nitrososphaeraceae archaeon]
MSLISSILLVTASRYCFGSSVQIDHRQSSKEFNFVAAGDFGCGYEPNKTIEGMISKDPEIVIALGDLSYSKSPDCWFNLFSPLETDGRTRIAIGDNEMYPLKFDKYLNRFNLTKPFYSFDYKNVHFLALATAKNKEIPYVTDSEQYKFAKKDLEKAHNNKKIKWIIVFQFRAFYSSNTTHPGLDELQDTYHRLFAEKGVDVVLQAHNHNYQRTMPILYNDSKSFTPIVTDSNPDRYYDPKGVIFITVGTGGEDLYNFTGQAPYVVRQFERHGFLNLNYKRRFCVSWNFL